MNEKVMREPGRRPSKLILALFFGAWAVLIYVLIITKAIHIGP